MPSHASAAAVLIALAATPLVSAHGYISGVVSDGKWYSGTSPSWIYYATKPATAGWYAENQDNGYVAPSTYTTSDIICHKSATNGETTIPVTAGATIDLQWNTWPDTHRGPVITYLANCGGDCTTVDKATLEFFKIDAVGLNDGSTAPGKWASDDLIANNFTASATIPSDIASGSYVLRHEIIALHGAGTEDGAQNYPQCLNVEVTGTGTAAPAGVAGTALYTSTDPGILINIYQTLASYEIPGPALYSSGSVKRTAQSFRA